MTDKPVITCPHCGNTHRAGARFCSRTGKSIPIEASGESSSAVTRLTNFHIQEKMNSQEILSTRSVTISTAFCPNCGEVLTAGKEAKFCNHCGFALSGQKPAAHPPAPLIVEKGSLICPYPDCQKPIRMGARFCGECYRRVRYCRKCRMYNVDLAKNCPGCRKKLPMDPADWPMFKGNPARTGHTRDSIRANLAFKWSYPDRSKAEMIISSPVVFQGIIYFGSFDRHLHALNQYNGNVIWKKPTNGYIVSTPAIRNGIIYVASCDGRIYAQDARDGKPQWIYPRTKGKGLGGITAPLLTCDAGLVAINDKGNVYCIDLVTGKIRWRDVLEEEPKEEEDDAPGAAGAFSGPAYYQGKIIVADRQGRVHCLKGSDGSKIFSFPKRAPIESRFPATPAISGEQCYIPDRSGKFYSISIADGEDTWHGTVNLEGVVEGSPAIGFGKVVVGTQTEYLVALNQNAGGEIWREKNEKTRLLDSIFSTPLITNNKLVFVGSNSGYVYCRDLETGEELWKYELDSPIRSAPLASDGFLYITTSGGLLYAFQEA